MRVIELELQIGEHSGLIHEIRGAVQDDKLKCPKGGVGPNVVDLYFYKMLAELGEEGRVN